ncbi:MAG: DUF3160 domain-containing protein [Sedimentisphaerales bacterium]|nr:DUF3160 domain-containing protein [Sedimentisphaerales bacterium]
MERESTFKIKRIIWVLASVLVVLLIADEEKLIHIDGNVIHLPIVSRVWADPVDVNDPNADALQGPVEPNFAAYYEPLELHIEPNVVSYELPLDMNLVTNFEKVNEKLSLDQVRDLISRNGFVVIEHDIASYDPTREDIAKPYEYLRDKGIPMFVTADTLLHLYHVQFDETLKEIEEHQFYSDIRMLTDSLLDDALQLYDQLEGDLKEATRRNIAYLSVASQLLGSSSPIPEVVSDDVAAELAQIDAHSGFAPSNIFIYREDYSQYVPRGHYTRSDVLKKYFKTLMWYGRMAFLLKGHENWGPDPSKEALINPYDAKIQTLQAFLLAYSMDTQQFDDRSAREIWNRIYTVTAFYVGLADDLIPHDYLWALDRVFGREFTLSDLDDPNHFHELRTELALLPAPEIYGGTGDANAPYPVTEEALDDILEKTKGMRFMGQRFIPDSYMFQNLIFPQVEVYTGDVNNLPFTSVITVAGILRGYPRGLDVMALLGSEQAKEILIQDGDTDYEGYWDRFNELADTFDGFGREEWNRNLYWGWLYSLRALIADYPESYPAFMQTPAWSKRSLNAALASWTELRHDTILYAKQPYFPPPPYAERIATCYVEPAPEFFARLLALTRMTSRGLSDLAVLSEQASKQLASFEEILTRLIEIATKELINQPLSAGDWTFLDYLAEKLEDLMIHDDNASWWETTGLKTTLVADVHTCGGDEERVLEEAVGKVDLIVVACPQPDGSAFLAAGPVLSYYEFKHPMADRLTDEQWREMLDSPDQPERPAWYQPLMR